MKRLIAVLLTGGCLAWPRAACADGASVSAPWFSVPKVSVWAGVSTLGVGGMIGFHNPNGLLGLRAGANFFRLGINFTQSSAHSRTQANFQNESLLLDVYPFHGGFRLSGGVVFNQNSANYSSTPELTGALLGFISDTHYTGAFGNVHGPISFNPVAPYFGVGYDYHVGKHWSLSADAGAMYQGNGRIQLIPTGLLAAMPDWRDRILANGYKADKMISKMSYYPVVSFQVGYRF
jgi:hypothetical protein